MNAETFSKADILLHENSAKMQMKLFVALRAHGISKLAFNGIHLVNTYIAFF